MRSLDRRRWLGLLPVLLALATGCGGEASDSAGTTSDENLLLQTFGDDYRLYTIAKHKPPQKIEDMKAVQNIASPAVEAARNGEIVVIWGAPLPDVKEEPGQSTAPEILAYGKDVPEQGGYVLHLDRTVSRMTAEEFKNAPRAAGGSAKAAATKGSK